MAPCPLGACGPQQSHLRWRSYRQRMEQQERRGRGWRHAKHGGGGGEWRWRQEKRRHRQSGWLECGVVPRDHHRRGGCERVMWWRRRRPGSAPGHRSSAIARAPNAQAGVHREVVAHGGGAASRSRRCPEAPPYERPAPRAWPGRPSSTLRCGGHCEGTGDTERGRGSYRLGGPWPDTGSTGCGGWVGTWHDEDGCHWRFL